MGREYIKNYKKGEIIYKEGDSSERAYLLDSGAVELYIEEGGRKKVVATIGQGEIFGEMGVIDGHAHTTSAVCVGDCHCSIIYKEQFNERINETDPLVRLLLVNYINKIRSSVKKNYNKEEHATKITDIKSFSMGFLKKDLIKTEEDVIEKIHLEKQIQESLDNDDYRMEFQPIIELKNKKIIGVEALIRNDGLKREKINVDKFMTIAEETAIIVPLGHWIIKTSLKEFGQFKKKMNKITKQKVKMFVSVNISARQIGDSDFFKVLQKATWSNKLKASEVKIEITERVLIDQEVAFEWIDKIREMGYSVAIDDFGTGFTNFSFLSRLNVNNIKIDKSFIQGIDKNNNIKVIVESLVAMAKGLSLQVIAEGVEKRGEYTSLQEIGCSYAQGHYFARPMGIEKLIELMTYQAKKKKVA